jgi:hypothetical protein
MTEHGVPEVSALFLFLYVTEGTHRKAEKKTGEMMSLSSAMFILVLEGC